MTINYLVIVSVVLLLLCFYYVLIMGTIGIVQRIPTSHVSLVKTRIRTATEGNSGASMLAFSTVYSIVSSHGAFHSAEGHRIELTDR